MADPDNSETKKNRGVLAIAVILIAVAAVVFGRMDDDAGAPVAIVLPENLSAPAMAGQAAFNAKCATCHGENAKGGPGGPPLIHIIYEPSHHADGAIRNAVLLGVRQHHWSFGDMAPVPGVSEAEIAAITAFVRETQRANGIH